MWEETKNNILVINSFGGGGAERQFSILADHLSFQHIICLEKENVYIDETKYPITYLTNHNSQTSALLKYLYTPLYAFKLYKQVKKISNPVIFSVLERSHLTVFMLSFILKLKYIMCFQVSHHAHYLGIVGKVFKMIFKRCAKRSVLCVSNSIVGAQEIVKYYQIPSKQVMSISNGYNFDEIKSRANQKEDCPYPQLLEQTYILCVARFFEQKAQDELIKSFKEIIQKHPNTKLVFAGIGDKLNQCIELSKSLGLKTFVHEKSEFNLAYEVYFLGFQRNPLVLMKHAKLFAFPTYYEGLPNALIEAMIAGTVVLSSDCPTGPREIIAPSSNLNQSTNSFEITSNGVLIKPYTNESNDEAISIWVDAINKLLVSNELVLDIKKSTPTRLKEFEMSNIAELWKNAI